MTSSIFDLFRGKVKCLPPSPTRCECARRAPPASGRVRMVAWGLGGMTAATIKRASHACQTAAEFEAMLPAESGMLIDDLYTLL